MDGPSKALRISVRVFIIVSLYVYTYWIIEYILIQIKYCPN